jgi:L-asparagine transporter-like permease
VLVVLVMRMLGEMAVAHPDSGSFSTYADRAIGHWAGFSIGWLYWWFWVLVIPIEATAAATILNAWFPGVATWIFALGITLLLTITNLFSVKNYGEFEFWFALIKVVAIVVFLCIGGAAILGIVPAPAVSGVSNLFAHQGFMPNGAGAVLAAMLTTMFSFLGTEIVTIAAAESDNPQRQIVRATNSVIWRITLFYLGSILVVAAIVPWNDPLLPKHGSYQRAMELIGVPNAKAIIDVIVLVSVASCLNSALYGVADAVLAVQAQGRARVPAPHRFDRHAARGCAGVDRVRLPDGDRELSDAGAGVRLPARDLGRDRAARVSRDRDLAAADAQDARIDGRGPDAADVAVPVAHVGGDPVHLRHADRDVRERGAPDGSGRDGRAGAAGAVRFVAEQACA